MKPCIMMLCLVLMTACARAYPPPGGERDTAPPRLIETTPAALTVVPANQDPVVFRFDERISERNFSEALVTVSPLDGALRIDRGRDHVRVEIDGGWRADRVYRVVLLPGIADLFGNARKDAAELVFSTGAPVPSTAIYGMVLDRITGRAAQRPIVTAARRADGAVYTAVGDDEGFYSLRHLPYGEYDLRAFSDQNNNRRRDSLEPVDSGRVQALRAGADTADVMFQVLSRDTTAAEVREATAVDSVNVRVRVSDYLDPATAFANATAEVLMLPDSTRFAGVTAFTLGREPVRRVAPADTAAARTPPPAPPPANEFIAQIDRALITGRYVIRVRGLTNIGGVAGGGGSANFEVRIAPRIDTLAVRIRP
jgi:hypothetical protein